jgi:pimeloyl-ACP methyl ester carboxylesterase
MAEAMEPALGAGPGWQRVYVDLPGTGESPGGPENSDAVVEAVFEFIDRTIGPMPFLLAGCSYGGYLAAGLARRWPERVAGLLLICAGVKIKLADRDLPAPGRPDTADWLVDVPPDLRTHLSAAIGNRTPAVASRIAAILSSADAGDEAYLQRLRDSGYQLSDEDSTTVYSGPTCVVAGRQDGIAGYADQFRALTAYPEATFAVLADAGHYLPFEQPDLFRTLVHNWLDRCADLTAVQPG